MKNTTHLFMPLNHMHDLYMQKNPLARFIHNKKISTALKYIPKNKKISVYDAGCGEGHLLEKIFIKNNKINLFGGDILTIPLSSGQKRCPTAKLKQTDLVKIDYPSNYFNITTCISVLEHIPNYEKAYYEVSRITKKNGLIVIIIPNDLMLTLGRFFQNKKPYRVPDHINAIVPRNILSLAKKSKLIKKENIPFRWLPFFCSFYSLIVIEKQ